MKRIHATAKFIGHDLRLANDKVYEIIITGEPMHYCQILSENCIIHTPYESIGAFLLNWTDVSVKQHTRVNF